MVHEVIPKMDASQKVIERQYIYTYIRTINVADFYTSVKFTLVSRRPLSWYNALREFDERWWPIVCSPINLDKTLYSSTNISITKKIQRKEDIPCNELSKYMVHLIISSIFSNMKFYK